MISESGIRSQAKSSLISNKNWSKAIAITIAALCLYSITFSLNNILQSLFDITIFSQSIIDSYLDPYFYFQLIEQYAFKVYAYSFSVTILVVLFWVFIIWPISLGIKYWSYEVANNSSPSMSIIFRYFKSKEVYFRAISFKFNLFVRYFLIFIICTAPAIIAFFTMSEFTLFFGGKNLDSVSVLAIYTSIFVLLTIGLIVYLIYILKYFLASYLFILDDEISAISCISQSCQEMKSKRFGLIRLFITFIPLFLLCFFVLPVLYVYPYIHISFAAYAKCLIYDITQAKQQTA